MLFAAMAVGASHLVQSTRAGASFGLGLGVIIVLTNVIKYPTFRFSLVYANGTGQSLLHGYRRQGRWAIPLFAMIALGTAFAAEAAVTLVTVGLAKAVFDLELSDGIVAGFVLGFCYILLLVGGYRTLDRLMKALMLLLTIATLVATMLVLPRIDWSSISQLYPSNLARSDWLFLAALVGLMPLSVDVSVFQSLWTIAKAKVSGSKPLLGQSLLDFHIGYVGTIILALCFMLLGAGTMYQSGVPFASDASGFATQLIELYVQTLGPWSRPVLGFTALAVMFSTVLAALDAYPRAFVTMIAQYRNDSENATEVDTELSRSVAYRIIALVLVLGALLILMVFSGSLKTLVDVAAVLAFLFAPVIAWLNHRSVLSLPAGTEGRPGAVMQLWSIAAIVSLFAMGIAYLVIRF